MQDFVYQPPAQRVVFGFHTLARIGAEVERLALKRVAIVTTPGQAARGEGLAASLGAGAAGVLALAEMHTPVAVTETALPALAALRADGLLALGGGSAIGLSKALALRTGLPQIAVPTSYAGSEATAVVGQTENGRKTTLRNPRILARTIVYDVELTLSLPARTSVVSGLNAIAHGAEALYAPDANPVTSALALQGMGALIGALPAIRNDAADRAARSDALFGAWACGTALGTVAMGLHHKAAHVLGGRFNLPHAETHAALLPHTIGFNEGAAAPALAPLVALLGAPSAGQGLARLLVRLGAPTRLRDLGLAETDLPTAARDLAAAGIALPRPVDEADALVLLRAAW